VRSKTFFWFPCVMFTKNGSSRGRLHFNFFCLHGGIFTFPIRRARVRPTLDLLDESVGARYSSIIVVYL
jgi:hypothetical protein